MLAAGAPVRGRRLCRAHDAACTRAVVAPISALEAGELLALAHQPRASAVAERIVQMSAEELQELGRRLRERLAAKA